MDINYSVIMAERLKRLREDRKLSHVALKEALTNKYGIEISRDSLMNYEVVNPKSDKYKKNDGMRVEYIRCLADFYGVSADYLLGITDDTTTKPAAVDELKLTPYVINSIRALENRGGPSNKGATLEVFNELLYKTFKRATFFDKIRLLRDSVAKEQSASFGDLVHDIDEFSRDGIAYEHKLVETVLRRELEKTHPELVDRVHLSFGRYSLKPRVDEICDDFREILEDMTGYNQLKEG